MGRALPRPRATAALIISPLFTTSIHDARRLGRALNERQFLVIGLCAAWCGTCKEFRDGFEILADVHPESAFVWLDVEDDAALVGDIEVENFPVLAIFHGTRLVHFGVSVPQQGVVARLLASFGGQSKTIRAEEAVTALHASLIQHTSRIAANIG